MMQSHFVYLCHCVQYNMDTIWGFFIAYIEKTISITDGAFNKIRESEVGLNTHSFRTQIIK